MFSDFDFKELRISSRFNLNCLYCRNEGVAITSYEMKTREIELVEERI